MKNQFLLRAASLFFVGISAISILIVSVMAFVNPQSVMDLVHVRLSNTDAASSIRGIYGGAGLAIVLMLVYLSRKDVREALGFLALLWGLYAISRGITQLAEGPLGPFGTQWVVIESLFCGIAMLLLLLHHRKVSIA
jgi:hypothetical protein